MISKQASPRIVILKGDRLYGDLICQHVKQLWRNADVKVWDHRQQRVCAAAHWETEKTDFGFLVHHRTNVFHDRLLGVLAQQVNERETLRASLRREADMSLDV